MSLTLIDGGDLGKLAPRKKTAKELLGYSKLSLKPRAL
jgi:hypothetical protein